MRPLMTALLVVAGIFFLSCGDSNPSGPDPTKDPEPGWLKVRLTSPNSDDGGIMFTIAGGQMDSIRSAHPNLFTSSVGTSSRRVMVIGDLINAGVVAEVWVPNVKVAADYSATVDQLAARDTYEQRQVSSVSLAIER